VRVFQFIVFALALLAFGVCLVAAIAAQRWKL
jgi:hypothetical protein